MIAAICRSHKQFVTKLIEASKNHPRKRTLIQRGFYADADDDTCNEDDPLFVGHSPKKSRNHDGYALLEFARFTGVQRVCFPNKRYDEQEVWTQQMKACAVMKMFDAMIDVVSGGDGASLKKKVLTKLSEDQSWSSGSSQSFEKIMEEATFQFLEAVDRKGKINALNKCTLRNLSCENKG